MEINLKDHKIKKFHQVLRKVKIPQNVKILNLEKNYLRHIPEDLIQFEQLKILNLSNNPLSQIVQILQSLPKLKELYLDEISGHDRDIFRQNLPSLKKLNGKILQTHNISFKFGQNNLQYTEGYNQEEEEYISNPLSLLFNCINTLFKEREQNYDIRNNISKNLKDELKIMAQQINQKETPETLEAFDKKTEAEINWFVLNQLSFYIEKYSDTRIAQIIQSITLANKEIMDYLFKILFEKNQLEQELNHLKLDFQRINQDRKNLRIKINQMQENIIQLSQEKIKVQAIKNLKISNLNTNQKNNYFQNKSNVISLIFQSFEEKQIHDQNQLQNLGRFFNFQEFLEQKFQKKFGLKSLVDSTMNTLYQSIDDFKSESVFINALDKILKFRISEDIIFTLQQIRSTLRNVFYYIKKNRNPNQQTISLQKEVQQIYESRMNIEDAFKILTLLYNEEDMTLIWTQIENSNIIQQIIEEDTLIRKLDSKLIENYINWKDYEELILKIFLENQIQICENYTKIFFKYANKNTGMMQESSFNNMVNKLSIICKIDINAQRVLARIDPANTQIINYSQSLSYFASYLIDEEYEQSSILSLINESIINN